MRILVTGAAGFIGSHLVNQYAMMGHTVFGLDSYEDAGGFEIDPRVEMVWGDIRRCHVIKTIKNIEPELINHHAAKIDPRTSMLNPAEDAKTNYIGTINVIEGAIAAECEKIVFASSCAVYGDIGATGQMIEGMYELPNCPYGISKLASEKYLLIASRTKDVRVVILRYPNVYGEGQRGTRSTGVIAIFAHAMARNLPIKIYGDGTAEYQYCHIDDVLRANLSAMHWLSDPNHTFLMANIMGHGVSVNTLAELIGAEFSGYDQCPEYAKPRDGEQMSIRMNGRMAETELNWKPSISLEEGVLRVVQAAKEEAAKDPDE